MTTPTPPPPPPPPPPAYQSAGSYAAAKPDNYLVWSIMATILCCLPFGVAAIVSASKVDTLWASGQHADARLASNNAKKWTIVSAIVGVIGYVIYFALMAYSDQPA